MLASDLLIGGAGNRGKIVEIGPQRLASTSDRRRVPPLGKSLRTAGRAIEGRPAQQLQRVIDWLCAHPFGDRRAGRLVEELALEQMGQIARRLQASGVRLVAAVQ